MNLQEEMLESGREGAPANPRCFPVLRKGERFNLMLTLGQLSPPVCSSWGFCLVPNSSRDH